MSFTQELIDRITALKTFAEMHNRNLYAVTLADSKTYIEINGVMVFADTYILQRIEDDLKVLPFVRN